MSVPFDLTAAGTCAATCLSSALAWEVDEFDADPELVDDESLPHATSTAAAASATIIAPPRDALFNIGSSPDDLVHRVLRETLPLLPRAHPAPVEGIDIGSRPTCSGVVLRSLLGRARRRLPLRDEAVGTPSAV